MTPEFHGGIPPVAASAKQAEEAGGSAAPDNQDEGEDRKRPVHWPVATQRLSLA